MSDELRRIGHIDTHQDSQLPLANPLAQPHIEVSEDADPHQALRELLELLGGGDTLTIYRFGGLDRSDVDDASLERQLTAMDIHLIQKQGTTGVDNEK